MIIEKIKANPVEDFHECYKWFSTWVFVSIPTLIALQENIHYRDWETDRKSVV